MFLHFISSTIRFILSVNSFYQYTTMKKYPMYALLLLLFTFGCKKNDDPQVATCQLTRGDDANGYSLLEYDTDGNTNKITRYDKSNKITSTTFADYSGGKLTQLRFFSGATTSGTPQLATVTTDAQKTIQSVTFPYIGSVVATLTYTSGRVATINYVIIGLVNTTFRYVYDANGNVSQVYRQLSGQAETLYFEGTYDNKTNPLRGNATYLVLGLTGFNIAAAYSSNNLTVSKDYDDKGKLLATTNYTYTYNDNGYPLTSNGVKSQSGTADVSTSNTYQYTCK